MGRPPRITEPGLAYHVLNRQVMRLPLFLKDDDYLAFERVPAQADAVARQRNLSPAERLRFHQAESGPLMKKLEEWFNQQFEDRLVEPSSGLGEAISYMLKHWEKLTLFLREPGAPLDNNITERALKRAILHRKNALFYMSENGAHVGDLFMSLIYTCQLCDVNPFDYLTELLRHADDLPAHPHYWMPWNYREALEPADTSTDPARG